LLKHTEPSDPGYAALGNAVSAIKKTAAHLNDSIARLEAQGQVVGIQKSIGVGPAELSGGNQRGVVSFFSRKGKSSAPELQLIAPSRFFLAEGDFLVEHRKEGCCDTQVFQQLRCMPFDDALDRGERSAGAVIPPGPMLPTGGLRCHLFLFNDVLVITIPRDTPGGATGGSHGSSVRASVVRASVKGDAAASGGNPNSSGLAGGVAPYELFVVVPITPKVTVSLEANPQPVPGSPVPPQPEIVIYCNDREIVGPVGQPLPIFRCSAVPGTDVKLWTSELGKCSDMASTRIAHDLDVAALIKMPEDEVNKKQKGFVTKNTAVQNKVTALAADAVIKRAQNTVVVTTALQPSMAQAVQLTVSSSAAPAAVAQGQTAQKTAGASATALAGAGSFNSPLSGNASGSSTPRFSRFQVTSTPPPSTPPPASRVAQVEAKKRQLMAMSDSNKKVALTMNAVVAAGIPLNLVLHSAAIRAGVVRVGADGAISTGAGSNGGAGVAHAPSGPMQYLDISCAACSQFLTTEDGLDAVGKHWHTECFRCVACGSPFRDSPYFEHEDQPYCKKDYLSRYGQSVCAGCMNPLVLGDKAVKVAGRVYHLDHYKCDGCGCLLQPDAPCYEREGAPFCSKCNMRLFGTCAGCGLVIATGEMGKNTPVASALGRNWHQACFTCAACSCVFPDGVYFTHADANGVLRAYCEADYLKLFAPRCAACGKGVENGLQACGVAWHRECFRCHTCSCSFEEGAYFEVGGKPYCNKDYYSQFGATCVACNAFITDDMVNACGSTWHPACFVCGHCKKPFPAEMEYFEADGKAYDLDCYCELFCPVCPACNCYVVEDGRNALGDTYHQWCLRCSHCGEELTESVRKTGEGKLYCEQDFLALVAAECARCHNIIERDGLHALEKDWHPECFMCSFEGCTINLGTLDEGFHVIEGDPFCPVHYAEKTGEICAGCEKHIMPGEQLSVLSKFWHGSCLRCFGPCGRMLTTEDRIYARSGNPQCEQCFLAQAETCTTCRQPILKGDCLVVLNRKYHDGCLACVACEKRFEKGGKVFQREGWPMCADHASAKYTIPDPIRLRMAEGK
jgi:hypothetical protein